MQPRVIFGTQSKSLLWCIYNKGYVVKQFFVMYVSHNLQVALLSSSIFTSTDTFSLKQTPCVKINVIMPRDTVTKSLASVSVIGRIASWSGA